MPPDGFRPMAASFVLSWRAMEEPEEPRNVKPKSRNLEVMSIEALGELIAELEAEIARAREAIAGKSTARRDAESVFD